MKKALVLGAGGFIGSHLVCQLKDMGYYVRAADQHHPVFAASVADEFILGDLRRQVFCEEVLDQPFDRVYQLAADMGGAGYIFTGEHDAAIMSNSVQINLNIIRRAGDVIPGCIFYSSSACIYPAPSGYDDDIYAESSAYPAEPDSEYGWEKLFSERLYLAHMRNTGLNVRIARLHNVFGPGAEWQGGREKAVAAICRKVITAPDRGEIEIWGDGSQTRSFLYIEECLQGIERLMQSVVAQPVNIGSSEMVSIQDLARMIIGISGKNLAIRNIRGPVGVDIRTSHNKLIQEKLGWSPSHPLSAGVEHTYRWIAGQIASHKPLPR